MAPARQNPAKTINRIRCIVSSPNGTRPAQKTGRLRGGARGAKRSGSAESSPIVIQR
jgi:hypothetical protein